MSGQASLELELDPPPESLRLVIPAVAIRKHRDAPIRPPSPEPAPRPRAKVVAGHADVYMPTWSTKEMERIGEVWTAAGLPMLPAETALAARFDFCLPRPKTHLNAGGQVKEQFLRQRPIKRGSGDFDNFAKLAADGLEGFAYPADEAIAEALTRKWYMDQMGMVEACTIVEIWTLA